MMELPEAVTVARQMDEVMAGKRITKVVAGHSPHKFAFFNGDPTGYPALLEGRSVQRAQSFGMFVRLAAEDTFLLLGDGILPRYVAPGAKRPQKHQLLLELEDGSALACSVQMYGGLWAFGPEGYDSPYYLVAQEKPSPLSDAFDEDWFAALCAAAKPSLSAKALLATEQRIPGLGNGSLQDILFKAGLHPKTKVAVLDPAQKEKLFQCLKQTLCEMAQQGGRDTEKDLFGQPGGYQTLLSAKTAKAPCPVCGTAIVKQAYLGGSVYFCPVCQPV